MRMQKEFNWSISHPFPKKEQAEVVPTGLKYQPLELLRLQIGSCIKEINFCVNQITSPRSGQAEATQSSSRDAEKGIPATAKC